jgi:NADPH-dependent 2,4-dienoyl-CoA reductase/sulfur reductase-like enzyme
MQRRQFLQSASAGVVLASTFGCASIGGQAQAKVVIVGGGYAGATAARYLRLWSQGSVAVTLIEPNAQFISCPLSNLVLGGSMQLPELTMDYAALQKLHGVEVLRDTVTSIDAAARRVTLSGGQSLAYDRLIVSPGIDFMYDGLPGLQTDAAQERVLHAWKAGAQTVALRKQLEAMPDGGRYALIIPVAPYRCPPGPYERACQIAHYFKQAKPKSKVLILDGNPDVTSKGPLFKKVWAERYAGIIEYQPKFTLSEVDAKTLTATSEFGDKVQADVLNVVPPQRAGKIAQLAGLANMNKRWCEVDFLTMESTQAKNIHVLGDAIQIAPLMPKSAHMANQHAKVCAAAVLELLQGQAPNPEPMMSNTCYSFVSDKEVVHVASVHRYDAAKKTMLTVSGSGGVSNAASELEGVYAMNWAHSIWADSLLA